MQVLSKTQKDTIIFYLMMIGLVGFTIIAVGAWAIKSAYRFFVPERTV
jgi:hypothetical protein